VIRTVTVAGWTISLLELDALHAPLRWVLPDAPENEIAWLPCHVLLCRRDAEVMLVDCGLGVFHDVFDLEVRLVALDDGLAAAGCSSEDVTTVVLTHLDADHAGGVVIGTYPDDLAPALPSARVVVLDTSDDRGESADRVLATLRGAGVNVDSVADGREIVPGVRLRAAPGHRAGHAGLDFSAGGERFVFLADVVHAREHVAHPKWDSLHDSDPLEGLATRRALLAELAGSGATVACSHVGAFGRIDAGPLWVDVT
jgi:glyoxylase-like metal-dependent hydrolase (beta-lactamase superfamily II)